MKATAEVGERTGGDEFTGVSPEGAKQRSLDSMSSLAYPPSEAKQRFLDCPIDELPGVSPEGAKQRCPWAWATVSALPLSQLDAMFPHGKP